MSRLRDLPRSARALMGAVVALGALCVAVRLPEIAGWTSRDLVALTVLVVAGTLAEQFNISIRHRTETENFTLTDAVWVPALLLGKPSVLTFAVVLATVFGQALKRWAWYKILFNASQFAVAITAAELVHAAVAGSGTVGTAMWISAILAMGAFFVVNEVVVAMIIASIEREPLRRVLVLPAGLNLFHAAANVTLGMIATLALSTGPEQLPLLIAPLALCFLAYRGWFQANQEDQQAKELMRTLYEAGCALEGRVDESFDFQPFLDLVSRMVNAPGDSAVQLVLFDGDSVRHLAYGCEPRVAARVEGRSPAEHLDPAADESTHVAAIGFADHAVGALAVRRRPPLSPSEAALVDALASQLATKQENRELFRETERQRSYLSDVIANSSDGIFVVDAGGRVLSWNPAMERIARVPTSAAEGSAIGEILDARLMEGEADLPGSIPIVAGGTHAVLIARPDGTERWIRYATNSMPGDGTDPSFVVVARDVTAEIEADRLKADFVATVSHELRTPLTPLKGFLLTLRNADGELPEGTRREYYDIMLRQAERLERLITDLLDTSQLESGRVPLEPRLADLRVLIPEQVEEAMRLPGARPIELELPDEPAWVRADTFRLGQALLNLLSNAFKYSPPDGPVALVVSATGSHVAIEVQDRGPGIPADEQGRIFERFYRVESGLTRTTGGAGLGLYISKRLIEQMGGTMSVRSESGAGSTFRVTLPRVDQRLIDGMQAGRIEPEMKRAG
jgi:PAS domain S-box-containing protein